MTDRAALETERAELEAANAAAAEWGAAVGARHERIREIYRLLAHSAPGAADAKLRAELATVETAGGGEPRFLEWLAARPGGRGNAPSAWTDVLAERRRQVEVKKWTPAYDDDHENGELADAAASYVLGEDWLKRIRLWPWSWSLYRPTTRRRDLVKAGALILAEIERLDRAAKTTPDATTPGRGDGL